MKRTLALFIAMLLAGLAAASGAFADVRVALVVGNSGYLNTPALDNPGNDANDVAAALTAQGFKVALRLDATKRDFDQALAQFARDARTADAALFYYAGHGMQFQGRNFLMPVDAELRDEVSLRYEMVAIEEVKDSLRSSAGVKLLVLDSCRDNPLANKLVRSISVTTRDVPRVQGFAREERANGMVIVYSTQADEVANDGAGRNSPFSAAFVKELKEPGLEVGALFRRVEGDVFQATGGTQSPEVSISLALQFYLNQSETDQAVWARVRSNADVAALQGFLERYPTSFYAPDAAARLSLLSKTATADPPPPLAPAHADAGRPDEARDLAVRLAAAEAEKRRLDDELTRLSKANVAGPPKPSPPDAPTLASLTDPGATVKSTLTPSIREELRRLGCFAGGDAAWDDPALKLAVARYVRYANLANPEPGADAALLDDMKKRRAGLCPAECSAREMRVGDRCVARTCPPGALLSREGVCERPTRAARVSDDLPRLALPARPHPRPRATAGGGGGGGGRCFSFNGNQYCE